jgi:hypothetical protein
MRRNLVVVRAGDSSLHPNWLPASGERSWDLIVSYFGDDPDRFRQPDVTRIDGKGPKWPGLHAVLSANIDLVRQYDYIWLPDDDIACRSEDIDGLFAAMRRHNLSLGQPALSPKSHFSWCITLRNPMTRLRWTNFVETMVPCFQSDLLIRCLPMLTPYISGWGLDWVWPQAAGSDGRAAIIDSVAVTHTRPFGGPNYKFLEARGLSAFSELADVTRSYGIKDHVSRISAILTRGGLRLPASSWLARWFLRIGYRLTILAAYVSRNPQRWKLDKRLHQHFADPANLADHAGILSGALSDAAPPRPDRMMGGAEEKAD